MSSPNKYKMTIAYDGTHYSGWQIQPNATSVQEKIREALQVPLRHPVTLIGSGRTDAGVHALGQVAHFTTEQELDLHRFIHSINGMLPHDIRIKTIELAKDDFHAQHSAIGKEYHYHLWLDAVQDPFKRLYSYKVLSKLDLKRLRAAAALFIGTNDFTTFANSANLGSAAKDPVRTLRKLNVVEEEGGVRLELESNGFLYKMVRNIVGTLLDVASHKRAVEEIPLLFKKRDRREASMSAPPQGLFLMRVDY